jgi:hypothetical protein
VQGKCLQNRKLNFGETIVHAKTFLTAAAVIYLIYGCWYFFFPQAVADIYGFSAIANPVSAAFTQFLGIFCLAAATLFGISRNAEAASGRSGALAFLAILGLLSVYMGVKTLLGEPGTMDYVDTALNALLGFAALYFFMQERKQRSRA